jgi:hypothetical protein
MLASDAVSRFVAVASFVAASLMASAAFAQDARDPAAAETLFHQGREAADHRDYATACAKFQESNRLDPAVGTVFNIADCQEKLGKLATAWTLFQEVVQRLPAEDSRRAIAEQRGRALESRVPKLTVRLSANGVADAAVRRDGVLLGSASLNTPLPVDPGEHVIVVEANGTTPKEFRTTLAEGQVTALDVSPGAPLAESSHGPAVASAAQPKHVSGLAYVFGGVGVAGVVTGAVAGALVLSHKSTVDAECSGKLCSQKGLDAAHSGKTLGVVSTVGFAVGVVGLGASTYLFLSGTPSKDERAQAYAVGVRGRW